MTGDLTFDLLISVAAIAIMVGISWLMGAWRNVPVDEASAAERLAFDEPDFVPVRWMVGADGKAAAALSAIGEAAFVFAVGDSLATRRLSLGAYKVNCEGEAVVAAFPDPSKPAIRLRAPSAEEAAEWAGGLGG